MRDTHRKADEVHDGVLHAHRVTEQQGEQNHLTGPEQSWEAFGLSQDAHRTQAPATGHGIAAFEHDDIAALAHRAQCFPTAASGAEFLGDP